MTNFRLTVKYTVISAIAVFASFFFHELSHWVAGELLGYKMSMTLNTVSPVAGVYKSKFDETIESAAGPAFTITQAIVFFLLMKRHRKNILLYPFLFAPLYMRILAGVLNFIKLNDEGRIGRDLGIGTFTLSILVCSFLFYLVYKISKQNQYTAKFQIINTLLIMLFSSIIILGNQSLHLRIIN